MKNERSESYKIEEDDFEGDNVCEGCPRLGRVPILCAVYEVVCPNLSQKLQLCTSYPPSGMQFRQDRGHCPMVRRYASWHKDKPIKVKVRKRIGQQKQRR